MILKHKFRRTREEKRSFWNITRKTNSNIKQKGIYGLKTEKK